MKIKKGRKTPGPKPKANSKTKMNPFEIHVNKSKHQVLGKKAKNTMGFPGIARHKAIQKRKVTLLQEYKIKDKANKFFDNRIGERNSAMTEDDRIMARFTAERIKEHKTKKSIFNLDDDAEIGVLTHKGRTLEDIEKFDDPRSDDEDNDDDVGTRGGRLDADFVEEAHFGGGLLSKSNKPNSHQDLIEKLIFESKKRKAEKMMNKEKTLEMTQKLDATWKELIPLVSASAKKTSAEPTQDEETKEKNSYDIALRQLKFEARGLPSDKLKSEEEIIREEKERLENLEAERLRRMRGIDEVEKVEKPKHQSADDLDDCFYGSDNEDPETLAYNFEGRPISGILKKLDSEQSKKHSGAEDSSSEESDEEEDEDNVSDSENLKEAGDDCKTVDDERKAEDENEGVEDEEESESSEDDLSDLKSDSSDDDSDDGKEDEEGDEDEDDDDSAKTSKDAKKRKEPSFEETKSNKNLSPKKRKDSLSATEEDTVKPADENKLDSAKKVRFGEVHEEKAPSSAMPDPAVFAEILKQKKLLMESARKELPYTFKAPENYEELENVFANKSTEQKAVIIERMIKCNHPSLLESNKEKLKNLFAFLLQHLNDTASSNDPLECWSTLDCLAPYLYDLCQFSPENAGHCIKEVIKEKQMLYRKLHRSYPNSDTLLFFKLVSLLFPTSDLRHPVVTPCIIFMLQLLHQCRLDSRKDIAAALFIVVLILEYTELSKRYAPEIMNVIQALLNMASPDEAVKVCLPGLPNHKVLVFSKSFNKTKFSADETLMKASDLNERNTKIDNAFRIRVIATLLKLITQFAYRYNELPASPIIFVPVKNSVSKLQVDKFPDHLSTLIAECNSALETAIDKKLEVLTKQKEKPKILKLYEPKIVKVYDMKFTKEKEEDPKAEHVKLLRTYRKEMKGAMREIRRDKDFISRIKFKEQSKSDAERRKKVKEIYSWGATQQGELNQMARKKKKK